MRGRPGRRQLRSVRSVSQLRWWSRPSTSYQRLGTRCSAAPAHAARIAATPSYRGDAELAVRRHVTIRHVTRRLAPRPRAWARRAPGLERTCERITATEGVHSRRRPSPRGRGGPRRRRSSRAGLTTRVRPLRRDGRQPLRQCPNAHAGGRRRGRREIRAPAPETQPHDSPPAVVPRAPLLDCRLRALPPFAGRRGAERTRTAVGVISGAITRRLLPSPGVSLPSHAALSSALFSVR